MAKIFPNYKSEYPVTRVKKCESWRKTKFIKVMGPTDWRNGLVQQSTHLFSSFIFLYIIYIFYTIYEFKYVVLGYIKILKSHVGRTLEKSKLMYMGIIGWVQFLI